MTGSSRNVNSSAVGGRRILSVVGPHSNCGKTLFVVQVVRIFRGLGCLKISPASPRADSGDASPAFWLEEPARIDRRDSDTGRYRAAGAAAVERLRHHGGCLPEAMALALSRFPLAMPLIVESSSAVPLIDPVAVLLVLRWPVTEMKPATQSILTRVTDVLINAGQEDTATATGLGQVAQQFPELRPRYCWRVDLRCEDLPEALIRRLGDVLAATPVH